MKKVCPKCLSSKDEDKQEWLVLTSQDGTKVGLAFFIKRFFFKDFPDEFISIKANICRSCGYIELFADHQELFSEWIDKIR